MVGHRAFFPAQAEPETAAAAAEPVAAVSVEARAHGSTFAAIACTLLDEDALIDVEWPTRAELDLVRRFVPRCQIVLGSAPQRERRRPWPAIVERFAGSIDHELLHARLRNAMLALEVAPQLPARLPEHCAPATTALIITQREDDRCARAMTPHNLRAVLSALASINRRAPSRSGRIEQALLLGGLMPGELAALSGAFAGSVRLTCLPGGRLDEDDRAAGEIGVDARALLTLVALQRRYRDNLMAIGFRSATLDAAALLGIPSFYFDETTASHWGECYRDGRYLVDARRDAGIHEHRLALTRAISTFIRVNIRSGPAQRDRNNPLSLDEAALADLLTALRVWMPRGLSCGQRHWMQRARLCRSGLAGLAFEEVRKQCNADARQIVRSRQGA